MRDKLIGRTLGDFEILDLIGRGRNGRVYRALQKGLNRKVALKVFEEGLFTPDDLKQRFQREGEYIARLEHPNILPIYAAGQEGEHSFFAMRLVEGGTLELLLAQRLPVRDGIKYVADVAGALHYAHQRGLIHRDVKPSNVLVADGAAMLVDFGVARQEETTTITTSGAFVGTPLYFSPEQARQQRAVDKSDIFAAGIILYEVVTRTHPFASSTTPPSRDEIVGRIAAVDLVPASQRIAGLPPRLSNLFDRVLAAEPAVRPTGLELQRELQSFASDPALDGLNPPAAPK